MVLCDMAFTPSIAKWGHSQDKMKEGYERATGAATEGAEGTNKEAQEARQRVRGWMLCGCS